MSLLLRKRVHSSFAAVVIALAFSAVAQAAPPPNDGFGHAQRLAGWTGSVAGSNVEATTVREPTPYDYHSTVWYQWRAPADAPMRVEIADSSFDSVLAVYTGRWARHLRLVEANNSFSIGEPSPTAFVFHRDGAVQFRAKEGTRYSIAVGSFEDDEWGLFTLRWRPGVIRVGTDNPDTLRGTWGRDILLGRRGADHIYGFGRGDTIVGGGGSDHLYGGKGDDHIYGNAGHDKIYGGPGGDFLIALDQVPGNDVIYGGPGRDRMTRDPHDVFYGVP
jgi:Ca2+-binding RTX toxin-like protein